MNCIFSHYRIELFKFHPIRRISNILVKLKTNSLKIFNSLGKKKQAFKSINKDKVLMYVCGPTVYDLLHVGNFRGPVFFNFLRNWLEHLGYKVEYVYNYTDIDDKIINKSNQG